MSRATTALIVAAWAAAAGCQDWGSAARSANQAPQARIQNSGGTSMSLGETAALSGAGSSDADGEVRGWQWAILEAPSGSVAPLADATAVEILFTPDLPGDYTLQLRVWDDRGAASGWVYAALVVDGEIPVADTGDTGAGDTAAGDTAAGDTGGDSADTGGATK